MEPYNRGDKNIDHSENTKLHLLLKFGDPSLEMSTPVYREFQRWRQLLRQEFQAYWVHCGQ